MQTTLNAIRTWQPQPFVWKQLLHAFGKRKPDDELISIKDVLDKVGLDAALFCLRAVGEYDKEIRMFAVKCARKSANLYKSEHAEQALKAAEQNAEGHLSTEEMQRYGMAIDEDQMSKWMTASEDLAAQAIRATTFESAAEAAMSAAENARSALVQQSYSFGGHDPYGADDDFADFLRGEIRSEQADELRRLCEELPR